MAITAPRVRSDAVPLRTYRSQGRPSAIAAGRPRTENVRSGTAEDLARTAVLRALI